ncbi:MAG: type II secretion system protein GspK [Proteobacteria bacterium]|nr:type II secretion system protein GspK [Pseudomonadota bacterium]
MSSKAQESSTVFKPLTENRGISIIISLTVMAFMISFIADLMVSSRVAHQMTLNLLNTTRAEYLAKSGEKLATFLLAIDAGIDLKTQELAKIAPADGRDDIWGMFDGIPIGGENIEMLSAIMSMFGLKEFSDSQVTEKLKNLHGSFTLAIADESSRINLSYLQTTNMGKQGLEMLLALLNCPAEKHFLETKSLTPIEVAHRIFDFIDNDKRSNKNGASGFSTESTPYQSKVPPYNPPNHPLESLDQLLLIEGWDSEMHAVFAPYLTVYPIPNHYSKKRKKDLGSEAQLNINTIPRELIQCIIPETQGECYEDFVRKFHKLSTEKQRIASSSAEITKSLKDKMCYLSSDNIQTPQSAKWFKTQSSTFRIMITGQSGGIKRVLTSVIHRLSPELAKSQKPASSVDMLYWRMGSY